ncbi:hypothetical protein E8E14_001563 [Neopestalotiopsis sp. 37M]|nr:hypothetical protein E8E14_001563 [Neopestalotiopsis sp. 37M]
MEPLLNTSNPNRLPRQSGYNIHLDDLAFNQGEYSGGHDLPAARATGSYHRLTSSPLPTPSDGEYLSEVPSSFQTSEGGSQLQLPKKKRGNKPLAKSNNGYGWRLDIAALILSCCALIALIALLIYGNNRPLEQWELFFSINTVVSILGTITRAPLAFCIGSCLAQAKWIWFSQRTDSLRAFERFEDASRGPMGSFKLVYWLYYRHWIVIGGILTVIILGFEPFLQAIISYEGQTSLDVDMLQSPWMDTPLSMNAGLYSPDVIDHGVMNLPVPGYEDNFIAAVTFKAQPNAESFAALFEGLQQSLAVNASRKERGSDKWASATVLAAATLTNPGMTVSFQDLDTMIAAVGIIKAESWNDSIISATECAWQFCTKLVSSKVENGVLQENISDVSSQRVPGSYMYGDDPFWYAYEEANHHGFCNYKNLSYDINGYRKDLQLKINSTQGSLVPKDADTLFNITQNTTCTLNHLLGNQLSETSQVVWPPDLLEGIYAPILSKALYEAKEIRPVIDNIANSLTTWIRRSPQGSVLTRRNGVSQRWVVYIRVQWWYLTLPALCFVGTAVFTALIILRSSRLGLQPWKSDLVATLTHSVDDDTRAQLRSAYRIGQLKTTADALIIKLHEDSSGPMLKKVS